MGERNLVGQVRDEPRAHRWDQEWCNGGEINPKTGADKSLRNFIVARDTRRNLGPGTERTASWETHETSDTCTVLPPVHGDPTDEKSGRSSDSEPYRTEP